MKTVIGPRTCFLNTSVILQSDAQALWIWKRHVIRRQRCHFGAVFFHLDHLDEWVFCTSASLAWQNCTRKTSWQTHQMKSQICPCSFGQWMSKRPISPDLWDSSSRFRSLDTVRTCTRVDDHEDFANPEMLSYNLSSEGALELHYVLGELRFVSFTNFNDLQRINSSNSKKPSMSRLKSRRSFSQRGFRLSMLQRNTFLNDPR